MPGVHDRAVETFEPLSDGARRSPARWVAPVLGLSAALVVAVLAVVTNLATAAVPAGRTWLRDGWVLWSAVAVLTVLSGVLAWWQAAGPRSAGGSVAPEPVPGARPSRLEVGELPGEPPSFQDRRVLSEMVEVFARGARVAVVCAVTGARGVGKTQIAAAYARQQAAAGCPLVAWVSGESADVLVAGLAEVARALKVASREEDSMMSARRLREHLESRDESALLVVDNAVDADALRRLLPVVGPTQVVITSTDHASFGQLGVAVEVSVFDRVQSLAYLRARTQRKNEPDAEQVAEELGDLPLALAQAASVIVLQRLSYTEYLARLQTLPTTRTLPRGTGDLECSRFY